MGFDDKKQNGVSPQPDHSRQLIDSSLSQSKSSSFDIRVFYIKFSNVNIQDSTPKHLTLIYVPLGPHTIMGVNGKRNISYLDHVFSQLRCNAIDKDSREAMFVNTDCMEITGSIGFNVLDGEDLLISGLLELRKDSRNVRNHSKWTLKCRSHIVAHKQMKRRGCHWFFKDVMSPIADVYIGGSMHGIPMILGKSIDLLPLPRRSRKSILDPIPEHETMEGKIDMPSDAMQDAHPGYMEDEKFKDEPRSRSSLPYEMEDENKELSWFHAGVRVGIGVSLGICIGVSIGVGLLAKTYQATSSGFRKRLPF